MSKLLTNVLRHSKYFKPVTSSICKTINVSVNTLSPLAGAFDSPVTLNTTSQKNNAGLFGIPELRTSEGFYNLKEEVLVSANDLVTEAIQISPSADIVTVFDTLSNELCKVADLAEFVRLAHPDEDFAKAAESASFEIGGFVEKLNTHYELYKALKNASLHNANSMDSVSKIVADLFLFDFEQSGIHLDEQKRKMAVELHEAILIIGAQFTQNTTLPRMFPISEWPRDLKIPYAIQNDSIVVDGMYSDSNEARLREFCYTAYMSPCNEQLNLFENLLHIRHRLASILGFDSFAHRTLKGTMASCPENVNTFLESTLEMLERPLQKELDIIRHYKETYHFLDEKNVNPWDLKLYTGLITSHTYNINSKKISEYFSVGACMEGLNIIFNSLYGVTLNAVEASAGEVWSPDVQKLEVKHENEGVLGYIYCDFFQRPGKLPQDCHFTIRGGKLLPDGSYQLPVVSLMCNFSPPAFDTPSLLSQGMVENLFHEMGHAMHSMLGRARYQHVTGTRCPTDFAEVPSILMEYFAMDPRIIRLYAKHYKTGQSLPEDLMKGLISSKKQFSAIDLQVQTFYSIVDQRFHGVHPLGKSTTEVLNDLHQQYSPITHVSGTSWHLRFSHFHSYAAKYYAYVWSKAVASRVWYSCFEKDPLSRTAGERYRNAMLRHGGGKPPLEMVEDMLGSKVTTDDLVSSLYEDVTKNSE